MPSFGFFTGFFTAFRTGYRPGSGPDPRAAPGVVAPGTGFFTGFGTGFRTKFFPGAIRPESLPGAPVAALPTTLAAVSYAVADRLVALGVAPADAVIFSRKVQPFPAQGYPQVVIGRRSFAAVDGHRLGAGRYQDTAAGQVDVTVNWQGAADQAEQDQYRLLGNRDPSSPYDGLEAHVHRVLEALDVEFVTDAAGNHLTVEPLMLAGNASPVQYPDDPDWQGVTATFNVLYTPLLTTP